MGTRGMIADAIKNRRPAIFLYAPNPFGAVGAALAGGN
jgi:hypothetical protein